MPLKKTIDRLRDLKELIADSAPVASATAPLFQLGTAIVGGNAQGTVLGGKQANSYTGDFINFQRLDAGAVARNRVSVALDGSLTVGDADTINTSIQVKSNVTGNVAVKLDTDQTVNQGRLSISGGIGTYTFGRSGSDAALLMNGGNGWLMQARASFCLHLQNSSLVDQWAVMIDGKQRTNQIAIATGPVGNVVGKEPIYDTAGNLKGYRPIYDGIT